MKPFSLLDVAFLSGPGSVVPVPTDDFDSYVAGASLSAQNGGTGWAGAYPSIPNHGVPTDDFDSYSTSDALDGLNAGSDFSAAYISRP